MSTSATPARPRRAIAGSQNTSGGTSGIHLPACLLAVHARGHQMPLINSADGSKNQAMPDAKVAALSLSPMLSGFVLSLVLVLALVLAREELVGAVVVLVSVVVVGCWRRNSSGCAEIAPALKCSLAAAPKTAPC